MGVDPWKVIAPDLHGAAAVGLVGGDEKTDVELALSRQLEGEVDPVLHFLVCGRLKDGHEHVLAEKTRVGRHLGRVAPRIVTHDDDHSALRMRARQVAERESVGGHVEPDAFHYAHGAEPVHLRAVDHGGGERLVVCEHGADAVLLGNFLDGLDAIEKAGDG